MSRAPAASYTLNGKHIEGGIEDHQIDFCIGRHRGLRQRILGGLTNDKAARILMDAVQDPELFRALLTEPKSVQVEQRIRNKLAPYLVGAASTQADEEEPALRKLMTDRLMRGTPKGALQRTGAPSFGG